MATSRWLGQDVPVAQLDTITVGGTVEAGDVFILTINRKAVPAVATTTNTTTTATHVVAVFVASTVPEFQEISFVAAAATITATSRVAGRAFTLTASTTESGGGAADSQTFVNVHTTVNAGPNDWSSTQNWDAGSVPVSTNDIVLANSAIGIFYGLAQSAVTLTSLTIDSTFTAPIGLPKRNVNGYGEYRPDYLQIGATTLTIGRGSGQGSGRIKIDNGTAQTTVNVYGSGQPAEPGYEAILWKGPHASNVVNVFKGSFAPAVFAGEVATIATLRVGYTTNVLGDAQVRCGSGVTLTTITQTGGSLEINSAATTITKTAGNLTVNGTATVTTLNENGGTTIYKSSGTITTLNVSAGGTFDKSQDLRALTITNTNLYSGATLLDPGKTITFTTPIAIVGCGIKQLDPDGVLLDLGTTYSIQRS